MDTLGPSNKPQTSPDPKTDVPTEQSPIDTPDAGEIAGSLTPIGREEPGRYELLRELARGGQGIVFVAWDAHLGREVAFKQLHANAVHGGDPTALSSYEARFVREARITAQLDHPGIAPLFEVGRRADGTLYATQRLVRGRTMSEALKECRTLRDRLALIPSLISVCDAVGYAHSCGVIHRDLKPGNILLADRGSPIVLDWGLGRTSKFQTPELPAGEVDSLLETHAGRTHAGAILGTPAYMSPEQAVSANQVDARADVWSLGVVLYEVLTGTVPFDGVSTQEVLKKVATIEPRAIRELAKRAPRALVAVAEKAMSRDAAFRYANASALGAHLAAWLETLPSLSRRSRRPLRALTLAAMAITALAFFAWREAPILWPPRSQQGRLDALLLSAPFSAPSEPAARLGQVLARRGLTLDDLATLDRKRVERDRRGLVSGLLGETADLITFAVFAPITSELIRVKLDRLDALLVSRSRALGGEPARRLEERYLDFYKELRAAVTTREREALVLRISAFENELIPPAKPKDG